MIAIHANSRFFLYAEPVNMRKSFEGLCSIVEQALNEEPVSGSYFIFLNRKRDKMKALYWDGDGLAIWYKRLEKGCFLRQSQEVSVMNRKEFLMLLEGVIPKRISTRYKC